jgi:hypothetical protein
MKKEKLRRLMLGSTIFGFTLIAFNTLLWVIFGTDAKLYPHWAALCFVIVQTALLVVAFWLFILVIKYVSNKEST